MLIPEDGQNMTEICSMRDQIQ